MEIPGLISLATLLISIQTIPFLESSLIPLPEKIAIPRSIPEPTPESAPDGKNLANIFKPEVGCVDYTFISGRIFNWKPATFITK